MYAQQRKESIDKSWTEAQFTYEQLASGGDEAFREFLYSGRDVMSFIELSDSLPAIVEQGIDGLGDRYASDYLAQLYGMNGHKEAAFATFDMIENDKPANYDQQIMDEVKDDLNFRWKEAVDSNEEVVQSISDFYFDYLKTWQDTGLLYADGDIELSEFDEVHGNLESRHKVAIQLLDQLIDGLPQYLGDAALQAKMAMNSMLKKARNQRKRYRRKVRNDSDEESNGTGWLTWLIVAIIITVVVFAIYMIVFRKKDDYTTMSLADAMSM